MAVTEKIINLGYLKKQDTKNWQNSSIPTGRTGGTSEGGSGGTSAARIRSYKMGSNTFITDGTWTQLVIDNRYYPRGQNEDGDCYGWSIDQNGSIVPYVWPAGKDNVPPPCGF